MSKHTIDYLPLSLYENVAKATGHDFDVVEEIVNELQNQVQLHNRLVHLAQVKRDLVDRSTVEEKEALGL